MIQGAGVQCFGSKPHELGAHPVALVVDAEALAFANGIPLRKRRLNRLASFLAIAVVGAFVVVALVRGPA